jgi:hypothetical protein
VAFLHAVQHPDPRYGASRRCGCRLRAGYGEQLPVTGHALELMDATVRELDT